MDEWTDGQTDRQTDRHMMTDDSIASRGINTSPEVYRITWFVAVGGRRRLFLLKAEVVA